ncbi:hypothetical protein GCM10022279_03080 [Comamonas faecalis]|uniref:Uncharacterized protein n=1 Tax=Comamonas faecalis TaxID=1387849 RepID=A0ABP7QI62_9BURK
MIAAYKTLGGSFTGNLAVDPSHLRDLRMRAAAAQDVSDVLNDAGHEGENSERRRRIRDAVEAALSDVILLGTAEQVRLAVQAANDMAAGRRIETAALVVSLRSFIREVLELDAIPTDLPIPKQGPLRGATAGGRGGGAGAAGRSKGGGGSSGGGSGSGGGGGAGSGGMGHGAGMGHAARDADAAQ